MKDVDRHKLRAHAVKALEGGAGGNGDPIPAIVVDAAKILSLVDFANSLEGLYRMHQQTETREMIELKSERSVLLDQIAALQSEANSWQSGYDVGRAMGGKHRSAEVEQLTARVESLQKDADRFRWLSKRIALSHLRVIGAESSSDTHVGVVDGIDAAMANEGSTNG